MQFNMEFTSNQKNWKGNYAVFMGNYLLIKVLERKLRSFCGQLTSNQSIGRKTMQFL